MKKIGFVIPWFGFDIPGGAEMELKGLVLHLHAAGVDVEIISTCVRSFNDDWSYDYHRPGVTVENGITIRRFRVRKRNEAAFDRVNARLMNNQLPLTPEEEKIYEEEMINSPDLYRYIREHKNEYGLFVFIPYMFGTTFYGIQECYEKAILIPCFHNEGYVYMECFKREFSKVAGMIFHAQPEADLAAKIYDLSNVKTRVLGEGVYTECTYDADRFRRKYNMQDNFILYAGRKDTGKNINTLVEYFYNYKIRNHNNLKLVLIGGGELQIPGALKNEIIDLGFVDVQDKFDAYAAASLLCQPSKNESFSLVVMESWLCERPVLVHEKCNVTRYFAQTSNGGLYFDSYFEFEETVNYMIKNTEVADAMGKNGRKFVLESFAWDVIINKYINFFEEICSDI